MMKTNRNLSKILHDAYPIASAAVMLPERRKLYIENIRYDLNKVYPQFSETINKRNNIRIKVDYEQMLLIPEISKKLKQLFINHNPEALI